MDEHEFGNRITSNAKNADDAQGLIEKALHFIEGEYGFRPLDTSTLFTGVYYDSKRVGSYITRVVNADEKTAVLKLQLRPLPFDEGSIIRNVQSNSGSKKIRPVAILHDRAWSEDLGFGYLLFEDLSHLPNLWQQAPTTKQDRLLHKTFLDEFFASVLPIQQPWVPVPTSKVCTFVCFDSLGNARTDASRHCTRFVSQSTMKQMALTSFQHFQGIAQASAHRHVSAQELKPFIEAYQNAMNACDVEMDMHFTHGHLSGFDVKHDRANNGFVLMANLYWSWRPSSYEMAFPLWVDLMHIRDTHVTLEAFIARVNAWVEMWGEETLGRDFWYILLQQSMTTIMLDLGASEWLEDEIKEKQALLDVWKQFFNWLIEYKMR